MGVNNDVKMDRGPVIFTSDVSLPKDDKKAMRGKQITAGQLTGLKTHRNADTELVNSPRWLPQVEG